MKHNCRLTYIMGLILGTVFLTGTAFQAPGEFLVVDTHEHIESLAQAELLVNANQAVGIDKTILIPSPEETLTLNGQLSFSKYEENVDEILAIAETYPDHFIPFCTVSPLDPDALEIFQDCHARGGKGLKLYNGHSYYYNIFQMRLDAPEMMPIYAYAEANNLPVMFHVNISKFGQELESVLDQHPDLRVSVPHFMVSSIKLERVSTLLDKYPNLYTDTGFGAPQFLASGLRRMSKKPARYANFINAYPDRILYGPGMVLSNVDYKNQGFMETTMQCYRDLLELKHYECELVADYYAGVLAGHQERYEACEPLDSDYCESVRAKVEVYEKRYGEVEKLNGLRLSGSVLKQIYETNPMRFLSLDEAEEAQAEEPEVEVEAETEIEVEAGAGETAEEEA